MLVHSSEKKNMNCVPDEHFREGGLNFNFTIASMKLNDGDIFPLPNINSFIKEVLFIYKRSIVLQSK